MIHAMIDIETMGKAVASIGAVAFDPFLVDGDRLPVISGTFYRVVDLQSSVDAGLPILAKVVYWWLAQEGNARKELLRSDAIPLKRALSELTEWYQTRGCERAWSHGATFDLVILTEGYENLGMSPPWHFKDMRDTRTLFDLGVMYPQAIWDSFEKHHALTDCIRQANAVAYVMQRLGIVHPKVGI